MFLSFCFDPQQRGFSNRGDVFLEDPDGLELRSPPSGHSASAGNHWPASAVPRNVPLKFPAAGSAAAAAASNPMHGGAGSGGGGSTQKRYAKVGGVAEYESASSGDEEGHEY